MTGSMAARRARSRKCMIEYTPDELRSHVQRERNAAHEIVDHQVFSLLSGIGCGMLMVAADQIERLTQEIAQLKNERDQGKVP